MARSPVPSSWHQVWACNTWAGKFNAWQHIGGGGQIKGGLFGGTWVWGGVFQAQEGVCRGGLQHILKPPLSLKAQHGASQICASGLAGADLSMGIGQAWAQHRVKGKKLLILRRPPFSAQFQHWKWCGPCSPTAPVLNRSGLPKTKNKHAQS